MRKVVLLLACAVPLVGCAEMTHLTRTRTLGSNQAILIDAKQRAIFGRETRVCAEPSPDALSALAASQGLNVATPEGTTVGQSLTVAETAAAIGLRTQSIQLMRDHMYRVCEAYLSAAIDEFTYRLLHRRFQTTMVGILAIEQLTGAMRPPAVVLAGSAALGNAEAVTQLTAARETQAALIKEAEQIVETKETEEQQARAEVAIATTAVTNAADDAARQAAQETLEQKQQKAAEKATELAEAEETLARRETGLAAIDRQLVLARSSGSASASGVIEPLNVRHTENVAAIADSVEDIVRMTMGLSNTGDFCTILLATAATKPDEVDTTGLVYGECLKILSAGEMFTLQ